MGRSSRIFTRVEVYFRILKSQVKNFKTLDSCHQTLDLKYLTLFKKN